VYRMFDNSKFNGDISKWSIFKRFNPNDYKYVIKNLGLKIQNNTWDDIEV
jgi:hypothetical protein